MENRKFKKILITGINGSVGSYLSNFLLKKKVNILGTYRNKITHKQIKQQHKHSQS